MKNQTSTILRALAEAEEAAADTITDKYACRNARIASDVCYFRSTQLRVIADRIENESQDQEM